MQVIIIIINISNYIFRVVIVCVAYSKINLVETYIHD